MKQVKIKYPDILICLTLVIVILCAYRSVSHFKFLNYDDDEYVTQNYMVQKGLSADNFFWALSAEVSGNWHPLTLLSHMADYEFFGLDAGKHHITSLLLHIANSLLFFLVFRKITGKIWQSAAVAALFALHPLHVESVAWVSERKDVLSTFFFVLTLWGYTRYINKPGVKRYIPLILFFALALCSKPMVVTLPFVLLLLDIWPLSRIDLDTTLYQATLKASKLVVEKLPLFLLSFASCIITILFQQKAGAVGSYTHFPLSVKIGNALVSYAHYLVKTIWPFNLAVLYPHPGMPSAQHMIGATLFIAITTFYAVKTIKTYPWFFVGWFWYIGTLAPVIGFIQVGSQAMADRYTYIPLIGIFIIISNTAALCLIKEKPCSNSRAAIFAVTLLFFFSAVTWFQVQHWKNSITLFQHTLGVTSNNPVAHNNLGMALAENGQAKRALHHFTKAIQIEPAFESAHNNIGNALASLGKKKLAEQHFRTAIRLNPNCADPYNNLGTLFYKNGRIDDAIYYIQKAVEINPDYQTARHNLKVLTRRIQNRKLKTKIE